MIPYLVPQPQTKRFHPADGRVRIKIATLPILRECYEFSSQGAVSPNNDGRFTPDALKMYGVTSQLSRGNHETTSFCNGHRCSLVWSRIRKLRRQRMRRWWRLR